MAEALLLADAADLGDGVTPDSVLVMQPLCGGGVLEMLEAGIAGDGKGGTDARHLAVLPEDALANVEETTQLGGGNPAGVGEEVLLDLGWEVRGYGCLACGA